MIFPIQILSTPSTDCQKYQKTGKYDMQKHAGTGGWLYWISLTGLPLSMSIYNFIIVIESRTVSACMIVKKLVVGMVTVGGLIWLDLYFSLEVRKEK